MSRSVFTHLAVVTIVGGLLASCSRDPIEPEPADVTHVGLYELREVGHAPLPSPIETLVNHKHTRDALSGQLTLDADGKFHLSIPWRWRDSEGKELERGTATYDGTYSRKGDSLFFLTTSSPYLYAPPISGKLVGAMFHGEAFGIVAEYERVSPVPVPR